MLKNIKLTLKLPIFVVTLIVLTASVVGYLSYLKSNEILHGNIKNTLSALTEARHHEMAAYFKSIEDDLSFQSDNLLI